MKIPEQIKIDLALRRAERLEFDPYAIKMVGIYLAVFFGIFITAFMTYAVFSHIWRWSQTCFAIVM
tara:strand:+ start:798 stop:995 length:198 start_codon:yes stop_codon:yes gene_type:complete